MDAVAGWGFVASVVADFGIACRVVLMHPWRRGACFGGSN